MTAAGLLKRLMLLLLALGLWVPSALLADAQLQGSANQAQFEININGLAVPYTEFAWYLMPGQELAITASVPFTLHGTDGNSSQINGGWQWKAPGKTGLYHVELRAENQTKSLNLFVMRPASEIKDEKLGEYKIGRYNRQPFRDLPIYQAPKGFIEVTKSTVNTAVSPNFTIAQFLSKQESAWPKYLVLRPELIIKLEQILAHVKQSGIQTDSLVIMSGFRTPWYNRAIGNRTSSSRHLYGGAADIYIDANPVDGKMDDLNQDGVVNKQDARFLYDLIESLSKSESWQPFIGGMAFYGSTAAHGPFVHVDARGYRARWGR